LIHAIETLQRAQNFQAGRLMDLVVETRGLRQTVRDMGAQVSLQQRVLQTFSQTFAAVFHKPPPPPPPPQPMPLRFDPSDPWLRCPTVKAPPPAQPQRGVGFGPAASPCFTAAEANHGAFVLHTMPPAPAAAAANAAGRPAAPVLGTVPKAAPLTSLGPPPAQPDARSLEAMAEEVLEQLLDMARAGGARADPALHASILTICKRRCPAHQLLKRAMEELLNVAANKPCFKYLRPDVAMAMPV